MRSEAALAVVDEEIPKSNMSQTYRGRALAVLRSRGQRGAVRVKIRGDGLEIGEATVVLV
jgi:hypothetical protein